MQSKEGIYTIMKQFIAIIIIAIFQLSCKENSKIKSTENIKLSLADSCKCFDGIGSLKNDEPNLTYSFKNKKSVNICGFIDKESMKYQLPNTELKDYPEFSINGMGTVLKLGKN